MVIQMDNQNTGEFNTPGQPVSPVEPPNPTEEDNASSPRFVLNLSDEELDNADVFEEEIHSDEPAEVPEASNVAPKKKKKKKGVSPKKAIFYTALVISLSILFAVLIMLAANDIFAFSKTNMDVQIEIPKNSSTKQIAAILKKNEIINYSLLFRFVSKSSGTDGKYNYGIYTLNPSMSYEQLMDELQKDAPKKDVVSVTIKEGMTIREIAADLETQGICKAADFINTVNRVTFGYSFENYVVTNEPLKYFKMEGYVFPDTYDFFLEESAESVCKKIFKNFNSKITNAHWGRMKEMGLSLEETLTLASLIQAESGQSQQMRKVSSVFWNRLDKSSQFPNLQSDVTINYVEKNIKPFDKTKNQNMYDAYNTYKCQGLPVAPICNPGLEAIEAALYPEDTKYFYFLTDKEGNFYYAKTLKEHNQNRKKAGV